MNRDTHTTADLAQLASTCVDYVKRSLGVELDFSQDTLPLLDHYLREAVADARREGRDVSVLGPLVPVAGAYFGEVVGHQFGSVHFHAPGEDYANYRVEFRDCFLHFNPLGIAHEVLLAADAPGWHAHFATLDEAQPVVEQSLASGLALSERDYYSFSVRYETLEQLVAVLRALEEQRKGRPRHFPHEVYESALGALAPNKS